MGDKPLSDEDDCESVAAEAAAAAATTASSLLMRGLNLAVGLLTDRVCWDVDVFVAELPPVDAEPSPLEVLERERGAACAGAIEEQLWFMPAGSAESTCIGSCVVFNTSIGVGAKEGVT